MNSPTGINSLVAVLDERREQLRNEGLFLLRRLVKGHTEIQKRVAFENAFEKVLAIVEEEGGLEGTVVTTDCFVLLHNLLSGNTSNQNWFRETGFFKSITELLQKIDKEKPLSPASIRNLISILDLVRLFVPRTSKSKTVNQKAFLKSGLVTQVIGLAFSTSISSQIRAHALLMLADVIHNNAEVQDYFAKASSIVAQSRNQENGDKQQGSKDDHDVSALFEILVTDEQDAFEMRYAATLCLQSFVSGDHERKHGVVQSILDGYLQSDTNNLLDAVLEPASLEDQYQAWFACCSLLQLTHEDDIARQILTDLTIGDAEAGEEEVSLIQNISANLVTALQTRKFRSAIAYAMLLTSWLYESQDNVSDFLEESSTLQSLITNLQSDENDSMIKGVCATMLSICYAYDFAESTAVNRVDLHNILVRVGRESIVDAIVKFSSLDAFRLNASGPSTLYTEQLLDDTYTEFFRDNYGLIRKAVDAPPHPVRSGKEVKREAEAENLEEIIADLEDELETKSSGLEEAIIIIKTRQEEVQRLREEVKYVNEKQLKESTRAKGEISSLQAENEALRKEATSTSNSIDKSAYENSLLHANLEKTQKELENAKEDRLAVQSKCETLEAEVQSEASKRSFLEKELSALQGVGNVAGDKLEETRKELAQAKLDLEKAIQERDSYQTQISQLHSELAASRKEQKDVEADATLARTRARDMSTELSGARQEAESVAKAHSKEVTGFQEELASLRAEILESATKHKEALLKLEQDRTKDDSAIDTLSQQHKEVLEDMQARVSTLEKDLSTEKEKTSTLEAQYKRTKELAAKALKAKQMPSSADEKSSLAESKLKAEIESLKNEKGDLQKQLEQAQADLMLLLEGDGAEDDATGEAA